MTRPSTPVRRRVLPSHLADWPLAAQEEHERRAADLQRRGGLPRSEAARAAAEAVRAAWGRR